LGGGGGGGGLGGGGGGGGFGRKKFCLEGKTIHKRVFIRESNLTGTETVVIGKKGERGEKQITISRKEGNVP